MVQEGARDARSVGAVDMTRRRDGRDAWVADSDYDANSDGWVVCRFCGAPIERSGFADLITGDDGWMHRDGSDVCATPRPRRLLGSER